MTPRAVSAPLYQVKGWIQFIGIVLLVAGILYAITIIGLIVAWLPIWLGVLLIQVSRRLNDAYLAGDEPSLWDVLWKLKTFFKVSGVATLIYLILAVLGLAIGLARIYYVE